jgi:hypothetical protein
MKDNYKKISSELHIVPLDVRNDKRLSDAAILLYGDLSRLIEKKDGSANISIKTLCEVTRKEDRRCRILINELAAFGYLRKSKTAFGAANSYQLIDPLEGIYQDLSAFLEFSHYFSSLKMQSLLSKYQDVKKLLYIIEALEWQYRKSNRTVDNPAGLIAKVMKQKAFTAEDDFVPGWWKKIAEKERRDKEAAKMRKKKEALEKSEAAKMDRWYESLSPRERKERLETAVEALRRNGGLPKFGAEISIRHKMYELYQAEGNKTPSLFGGKK